MTRRSLMISLSLVLGLTGAIWAAQQAEQEPDVKIQAGDVDVEADVQERPLGQQRQNLQETQFRQGKPLIHRASALIGLEVRNDAGKDLGEINDLAIDGHTGKIEYAAVSFGGFVGVGDKLFAVPWDALQVKQVGDREDDNWIATMNVSQEMLETAKGFNKDNWPDMADERWRTENDRVFRSAEREPVTDPTPRQ